jgi:sugar/nucleoside kinase (ribokinase family)
MQEIPKFDVATLGEMMMLLVADQPGPLEQVRSFQKRTAGAETNVAIGLARLGLRVSWASRLGNDSLGRWLLSEMQREGVDCSRVLCDSGERTGLQFKERVTDGSDPFVESHRKGSAASRMGAGDVEDAWLLSARHLHATGIFPGVSATCREAARKSLQVMRAAGRTISFDPNLRPGLWGDTDLMRREINSLAGQADWVLPGLEEGRFLTGHEQPEAIARFYRAQGARLVVIKLGPDGAYFEGEQGSGHVPAYPVERVVDTVGAGDGFAVGVVSALLEGLGVEKAVRRGAWIGARAVQVPGDTEGLPIRAELAAAGL